MGPRHVVGLGGAELERAHELADDVKKAMKGDRRAWVRVRDELTQNKAGLKMLVEFAGGEARVQALLLNAARFGGKDNYIARGSLQAQFERSRDLAAGPAPSGLEALLAERLALAYVSVLEAEGQYAMVRSSPVEIYQAEHLLRRLGAANKRFLAAAKTLAEVRRLARPNFRVVESVRHGDGARGSLPAEDREAILKRAGLG